MHESGKREGEKRNLDPARDKSLSQRGGENKRTIKCISLRKKGRKPNQKKNFCEANEIQFVHKNKWTLPLMEEKEKAIQQGDRWPERLAYERERENRPARGKKLPERRRERT